MALVNRSDFTRIVPHLELNRSWGEKSEVSFSLNQTRTNECALIGTNIVNRYLLLMRAYGARRNRVGIDTGFKVKGHKDCNEERRDISFVETFSK